MDRERIGPYRFVRLLGKGGMGTVFEAIHEAIERRVAIKILHPEMASNPEHATRFLNEARATNRIGHPGIVEIHDFGSLPDGTTFLVMEFLEGETLSRRFHRLGCQLPLRDVLWIGREAASAVAAAHKKGIIHRDLKPDNILLAVDPESPRGERVKLLDFGIAKVNFGGDRDRAVTQVGTIMGTLSYISPEQLRNTAQVDDRADVYSLGALLYHLLSGRPPFPCDSDAEIIAKHLLEVPRPIREAAPTIPEPLCSLIDQMLAKDPQVRLPMAEVARRFADFEADEFRSTGGPQPNPLRSGAVPLTAVRRSGSLDEPQELDDRDLIEDLSESPPPLPFSQRPLPAAPSASTVSGAASEAAIREHMGKRRRSLGTASVVAGTAIVALLGWSVLRKRGGPQELERPGVVAYTQPGVGPGDRPAPSAPPVVEPARVPTEVKPEPSAKQETPAIEPPAAEISAQPLMKEKRSHAPGGCQKVYVSQSCIVDSKGVLSADMKKAVVSSLQTISLRVCRGRTLRAVREGNRMIFEPRGTVSQSDSETFSLTMRGLLVLGQGLPAEVLLKCGE